MPKLTAQTELSTMRKVLGNLLCSMGSVETASSQTSSRRFPFQKAELWFPTKDSWLLLSSGTLFFVHRGER